MSSRALRLRCRTGSARDPLITAKEIPFDRTQGMPFDKLKKPSSRLRFARNDNSKDSLKLKTVYHFCAITTRLCADHHGARAPCFTYSAKVTEKPARDSSEQSSL